MVRHTCHAYGCERVTPRARLMCVRHWAMVPPALKNDVLRTYRKGQETLRVPPSNDWCRAARAACDAVAAKEKERRDVLS